MRKLFLLLVSTWVGLGLFASPPSNGNKVLLNADGSTKIELVRSNETSTEVEFNVSSYSIDRLTGDLFSVSIPEGSLIQEKGSPDLEKLTSSIIVSETNKMAIEVTYSDYVEVKDVEVGPSRGVLYRNMDLNKIPFEKGKAYEKDEFFPGKLAELRKPYIAKDFRGQTIVTYPLQYNPVTKVLRIYTTIKVEVKATQEAGVNQLKRANRLSIDREFKSIYKRHFLNYSQERYDPLSEEGNMLVVCHPDYIEEIAPFIEWKTKKGMEIELVEFSSSTTGTTANALKTYLTDYYNEKGLTYLLLVGDAEDIPSLFQGGDSDVAYSYMLGNDSYPEFFVGRFSAENGEHVTTQVNRLIYYERDIDQTATWLNRGLGIASDQGGGSQGDDGESDIVHMNNIKADLISYGYESVAEVYDPGASADAISAEVNQGVGIIDYVGHGSNTSWITSGFSVADCNALTNVNQCPFIFSVACVNGNFHGRTCFAEGWARASSTEGPTGAIAMIASTINQSWNSPMAAQDEMIDILVGSYDDNIKHSFGGIAYNSCMLMNDEYGADGSAMTNTWTTFGDPSVMVRTKAPEHMEVSHDSEILIGVSSFDVAVDAEGALACLSLNGEILGTAIVSGGIATINFEGITEVVNLDLVVTSFDKVTYLTTVSTIPADGPYLSVKEFIVNDENGNGMVENNESFNIDLTLKNVGLENSEGIKATITSQDANVTVTNNVGIDFPNINAGQTSVVTGQFNVVVGNNIPDQNAVEFNIEITDNYSGKKMYETKRYVVINSPKPKLIAVSYNDDYSGNVANGIIDAGETGDVLFEIENVGHASYADLLQSTLSINDGTNYFTINTEMVDIENNQVSNTIISFNITAHEDVPLGQVVGVDLLVKDVAFESLLKSEVVIGEVPIYFMGENDVVTSCSGVFYDTGGETGGYSSDENLTITFKSPIEGNSLFFEFESFEIENGYDKLYVYDGLNVNATPVAGSPFTGSNISSFTSTNADGAITFKFKSDGILNKAGWKANFHCVPNVDLICSANPMPEDEAQDVLITSNLKWDAVSGAVEYDVYLGITLPSTPTATVSTNFYNPEDLERDTTYMWKVIPKKANGEGPDECDTWTFKTYDYSSINQDKTSELTVYPNPSNGNFNFAGANVKSVVVYNTAGIMVAKFQELGKNTINLSQLENGIYYMNIVTEENKTAIRKVSILK